MVMKDTALIVDDDVWTRNVAASLLRACGVRVLSAIDATEACDILCCEGAAVVVLDMALPGTRGAEILRRLRGRFETHAFPTEPRIVAMADWAEPAVERLARSLGADAFVSKPIVPGPFVSTIERLLTAGQSRSSSLCCADRGET
jgi:CheY-like chemotaxis protein